MVIVVIVATLVAIVTIEASLAKVTGLAHGLVFLVWVEPTVARLAFKVVVAVRILDILEFASTPELVLTGNVLAILVLVLAVLVADTATVHCTNLLWTALAMAFFLAIASVANEGRLAVTPGELLVVVLVALVVAITLGALHTAVFTSILAGTRSRSENDWTTVEWASFFRNITSLFWDFFNLRNVFNLCEFFVLSDDESSNGKEKENLEAHDV